MPSILIPPDSSPPLPSHSKDDGQLALWNSSNLQDIDLTPHILIQLQDDIERARMREAYWISAVVHLGLVIFLFMSPHMFPGIKGVVLLSPQDIMRNQQLTYLDLPPDGQKAPKPPPEPKALSDKNRIAESRHPSLDKKTLEELKRAGPPAPPSQPGQTAQMSPPMQQGEQQPNQSQNQPMAQLEPVPNPKLPVPAQGNSQAPVNFADMMKSPGDLTAQAARAAAAHP